MQGHLSSSFWEGSRALSVHPNGAALEQRWRHQKGVLAWKFVLAADVAGCFVPCLGKKRIFNLTSKLEELGTCLPQDTNWMV